MKQTTNLKAQKDLKSRDLVLTGQDDIVERRIVNKKMHLMSGEIAALKKEKTDLQELLAGERQVNQLQNQFLAVASHDLRSPLTSMQLSASIVEQYYDRLEKQKLFGHLERIRAGIAQFTTILDSFFPE
jgi:two-component system sensor kinase FixL